MSRSVSLIVLVVIVAAAAAIGYQAGSRRPSAADPAPLRSPRSVTTVPDGFSPPGVTGEVRDVLLMPDFLARTEALAALLSRLGPESVEDVRAAYDSVLLDLGDTELVLLGEWWARFDPEAALAWTNRQWETRRSMPVIGAIMRAWGRTDPQAAIVAASAARNNAVRRRWIDQALRGWDESRYDGALAYAESLAQGPDRQWALYVVTRRRVLRDGPEAALAWAESLPDDDETFKLNAFRRVTGAAAEVDPELAAAFAERHLDGPYAKGLPYRVGMHWIDRDPDAALAWLKSLPEGANRNDGIQESFRHWMIVDRPAARAWIQSAEHAPWLDPAFSIYARGLGREKPEEALRLASGIHDPAIRLPTMGVIAREWLVRDPEAADAWLDQSDLPPDFVARIRIIPEGIRESIEQ
jgi:hypothetical protein